MNSPRIADTLITGATIVTMDSERRVISDGAIAIEGDRIVGVANSDDLAAQFSAKTQVDGRRFVVTPGMVNGHVHVTGDPLTRAWLPDVQGDGFENELVRSVLPRFHGHTAHDERVSAELASLKMLASGTTTFLEAGTVNHLTEVVAGANATGIRGRVGTWVEGRDSENPTRGIETAIRTLEEAINAFPADGARIAAWPILVGHSTNPDEVWKAAKALADRHGLGVAAHMSPYEDDPNWFLAEYGQRPIEHLDKIGVLGDNVCLTHLAHVDPNEVELLANTGSHAVLCPLAALRGAFGLSAHGRFPEMIEKGINVMIGSDGYDQDLLRQGHIIAGVFKDARRNRGLFSAEEMLTLLTLNGARGLGLGDEIGSLEVGKKADLVCHDTDRPEWQPRQNVLNQLAWLIDGRSVHSVWVDGRRVLEDYGSTLIDEEDLYRRSAASSRAIMHRAGLTYS